MITLAQRFYIDTRTGSTVPLPRAGTSMENPFVFDACAREIKSLAERGCVDIVSERRSDSGGDGLITELVFKKLC
jgi:hypothetical protein